jgi:hypothetical protein
MTGATVMEFIFGSLVKAFDVDSASQGDTNRLALKIVARKLCDKLTRTNSAEILHI